MDFYLDWRNHINIGTSETLALAGGFYGLFKKDADLYADYGGELINLTKFKNALGQGMTKEEAALQTTIGKFAEEKGFNKVEFDPDFDIDNLNEVHVIFYK